MLALLLAVSFPPRSGLILVSPAGSDSNPGTIDRPVATLEVALDLARKGNAKEIVLRAGDYPLVHSVRLDSEDSGLTIRSETGKRALLDGSLLIPAASIHSCTDHTVLDRIIDPAARPKIREVDLGQLGLSEIAPILPRGFPTSPATSPNELFSGRDPLTLARWPNADFTKIVSVSESGNGEDDADKTLRKPVFKGGDRPKLWVKATNVWLYGYWKFDWADESIPVDSIDPATGAITLAHPHPFGVEKDAPFFAENLLEELDAPGEYYIDRDSKKLYFIAPSGPVQTMRLSVLGQPMIEVGSAENVSIEGLDFGFSRADGVHFTNCTQSRVAGCRFFDLGSKAAVIDGGSETGVQSCNIWNTGEGGVVLSGGDRSKLDPAKNYVDDCEIFNYQRRSQTYRPAVSVNGCGNRVTHCSLHDSPHSAIIYGGNNHLLSMNEVYRTVSRTGDGGVFYAGRDWTARGTLITKNYFHDNVGQRKWEPAIYLDDQLSGEKIIGNRIERCHWGFLIGGGRDNVAKDNAIIDCDLGFDCDARGLGWASKELGTLVDRLKSVPYQVDPWKGAYPTLVDILTQTPMAPMGNVIDHNLLINSGKLDSSMEAPFKKTCELKGNVVITKKPAPKVIPSFNVLDPKLAGLMPDRFRKTLHD